MIDYREIASTCSRMDTLAEERGLEIVLRDEHIELRGLFEAAEQRAIRIAMIMDGEDPRPFGRMKGKQPVHLSPRARAMMRYLQMAFVDGFVAGRCVSDPTERIQRFPERED